jgi:4-amino-4-deoxy-L-arabinose transferase-like glycosyltransferase
VPWGWSNLDVYDRGARFVFNGNYFQLVHPYLDHPPLFGLLVGAVAWLQGAREFTDVTAEMIRPVPIVCSVVAIWLAYLLGRAVLGAAPAMVGIVLLASAPAAILVQRQVEAEALLAPLLLGTLLLVRETLKPAPGRAALLGMLACCAIAPLVKVSGVAVAAIAAAVLLSSGSWRLAAAALASGVLGLALFFAYGAVYDWNLFLRVVSNSESHRYGVLGVYQFIAAPAGPEGANGGLRDGWWLYGWLALAMAIGVRRERRFGLLAWPVLGYAVVIMLLAEHISYFGWFRVAVYPSVYMLAGWLAWRSVREPSALGVLLLLTVAVASVINPLLVPPRAESWAPNPYLVVAALAVLVAPPLLAMGRRDDRLAALARYSAAASLVGAVGLNLVASLDLANIYQRI